jgi:hypothetical protein
MKYLLHFFVRKMTDGRHFVPAGTIESWDYVFLEISCPSGTFEKWMNAMVADRRGAVVLGCGLDIFD